MYNSEKPGFPGKEDPMHANQLQEGSAAPEHPEKSIEVSISTTAGFFPAEGFIRVPSYQKVEVELEKANRVLKIKDTADWVAAVTGPAGQRRIDPAKTYSENRLSGKVEIDWGPSEGGGG